MRIGFFSIVAILVTSMAVLAAAADTENTDIEALLDIKNGIIKDPSGKLISTWNSKSVGSDGCPIDWYGIICNNGRVTSITINDLGLIGHFNFASLTNLKLLSNLTISNNQLTGNVSSFASIDSTFLSKIDAMASLEYLNLMNNQFSGDIISLISQLMSVKHVDLSSNAFTGSLDLVTWNSSFVSTVTYLNVSSNQLSGQLFAHDGMPFFDSLEVFDATNNQFSGVIPSFNFIVSLKVLRLGNNRFSGSIPEGLLRESSMVLFELDLSHNQLEGPVESITSMTMKYLNLSSNRLSGFLPLKVGHCAVVDLSNNQITGNISRMQNWGNYVEIIDLSSNLLKGSFSNGTSQFLRLSSFRISNNSVGGILHTVWGTYPELKVLDLSLNQINGGLDMRLFALTKIVELNLSGNQLTGPLLPDTMDIITSMNISLVILDISSNSINGSIPNGFNAFRNLLYLNLSRNLFTGNIPEDLPDNLKELDLTYNDLSGAIPGNLRMFLDSSFHPGNTHLMSSYPHSSPKNISEIDERNKSHLKLITRAAVIAAAASVSVLTIIFCTIILYRSRRKKYHSNSLSKDEMSGTEGGNSQVLNQKNTVPSVTIPPQPQTKSVSTQLPQVSDHLKSVKKDEHTASPMSAVSSSNPSVKIQFRLENNEPVKDKSPEKLSGDLHLFNSSLKFTADELSVAPAELVDKSCHGMLYRAVLPSGEVLAVKWLKQGIAKSKKEFSREVKKLGSIKHPNLVSLQGYFWGPNEHEKVLISYFIDAPCLALYLQGSQSNQFLPLTVDQRLKIAVDIARCLDYLHTDRAIPHGNLKSTNILLELSNFTGLLTDYSLHRIMTHIGTSDQILNSAALGYIPPEFLNSSKPSPSLKSDVYAFGIILLELVTGKCSGGIISSAATTAAAGGVVDLPLWVLSLVRENRVLECLDRFIVDDVEEKGEVVDGLLDVGMRCVLPASERPDMRTVFEDISALVS